MAKEFARRFRRQLQLDRKKGWVFGVCAGLARYYRCDPSIIRVSVVICGLFVPKLMIASYLIAWLVLDDRGLLADQ